MTTTTIFASTLDAFIRSENATYATAAAGTGTIAVQSNSELHVGQSITNGNRLQTAYLSFDTSVIPDDDIITQVELSLFGKQNSSATDFDLVAKAFNWSASGLATTDWRTPTQLSALTTLASLNTSGISISAYNTLTSAGAAFNDHINTFGVTYLLVASSRLISATAPAGDEFVVFHSTSVSGTDFDPKLVITHNTFGDLTALVEAGSYVVAGGAADLSAVFPNVVAASAGAYSINGQLANITKLKIPLWENSIAQNPLDYIYGTDPDQFERLEYVGINPNFDTLYPGTSGPAHLFRVHFRDKKTVAVTLGNNPFATTINTPVVRVTHTAHGMRNSDHVVFSGTSSTVGGLHITGPLTEVYRITYVDDDHYDITFTSNASSSATGGGAAVVATYNQFRIVMDSLVYSRAEAEVQALLLAPRLGKMPRLYRENTKHVLLHAGDNNLTSNHSGHSFTIFADRMATRISNNDFEESCLHEGTHSSIQSTALGIGIDYGGSAEWAAAKAADGAYITEYATTTNSEDLAESALFGWTHMLHPERLEPYLAAIAAQIPNRLAFFKNVVFAGHITACARISVSSVVAKLPAAWIDALEDNTALASHCRDVANLKVEAYYSHPDLVAGGVPDLYKFYCNVCGRAHPRHCSGGDPRPFWDVR